MKLLLLADVNSSHTIKWVTGLAANGIEICLVGLTPLSTDAYANVQHLSIHSLEVDGSLVRKATSLSKVRYLSAYFRLRRLVREFSPDLVHAHYASSYGLLGAMARFHPLAISVWGSDVVEFPRQNRLNESVLKWTLRQADIVLSTSHALARETAKYTRKKIVVTPFGVDVDVFEPKPRQGQCLTIGTVKSLEKVYGTEYLLRSFALVKQQMPDQPMQLLLVGGGSQRAVMEDLARQLGILKETTFTGPVPFAEVAQYHQSIDIAVFPSLHDSFGVAALEASSCGNPVIVSDTGGLPEVVEQGVTGIVVPRQDVAALAEAIELLVKDKDLRQRMGTAARQRAAQRYRWSDSVNHMLGLYGSLAGNALLKGGLSAELAH